MSSFIAFQMASLVMTIERPILLNRRTLRTFQGLISVVSQQSRFVFPRVNTVSEVAVTGARVAHIVWSRCRCGQGLTLPPIAMPAEYNDA